jgi:RNA polymerase sigma-70 factor (ECF subfamily)
VQGGDTDAFGVLVEKYKQKVFRLAYGVLRDQEEAMDVAQEAFVKAYRALGRFKGDSAFYTWLFRITMNVALDRRRQRLSRARALGGEEVPQEEWERTAVATDPGPVDEAVGAERRARIGRALETLSPQHRSIIILSDIEGLAYREIAEVLQIPMGTVMSRLHNARKRLREALGTMLSSLLLAAALAVGPVGSAAAQGAPPPAPPGGAAPAYPPPQGGAPPTTSPPGYPPPGVLPPASGSVQPDTPVCVYALVLLATTPPAAPPGSAALSPTPDLKDDPGPPAPGGGCGQPMRVGPWIPRLRGVFGYTSYRPISAFETFMPFGMSQRFALPGGRELEIRPLAHRVQIVRMLVKVNRGPVSEIATVMDVPPRRPALIGGPPHGEGVLIIAIRARVQ